MVREIRKKGINQRLKSLSTSKLFLPSLILIFVLLTIPVIRFLSDGILDFRQRAAQGNPTATMNLNPSNGNYTIGQQFTISLVIDGGGQDFNAAQADISVTPNLEIQSLNITPAGVGGCDFVFVNQKKTPSALDPSFAGAVLQSSKQNCTLFTMTLLAKETGVGLISLTKTSVKSYTNHADILLSSGNGSFTITSPVTPTIQPTTAPTATPTTIPSSPTPTSVPPTPTPSYILLNPPVINDHQVLTYDTSMVLTGTKTPNVIQILVNNSTNGVSYPSSTTWSYTANLNLGENTFRFVAKDDFGNSSEQISTSIYLHELSDISGDNIVDITDLSIFGADWEKTSGFNNPLSDMDKDGRVDLTDFSILASNYGN